MIKMIKRFSKIIWSVLVMAFVVAGCQQGDKEDVSARGQGTEAIAAMPDYASRAIEVTGGRQVWTKTKRLDLDCVVTFYQPDGSFYLTEQHYEIYPWSNSIRISALEPQGKFVWQLAGDGFSILEGAKRGGTLTVAMCQRHFAEAILNITTAPARLLESRAGFAEGPKPVKMQGLWYYPIERTNLGPVGQGEPYWSTVVFYQNTSSSLVDILWFAQVDEQRYSAVRGYDYSEVPNKGIWVPTRIEIFRTNVKGVLQQRMVKIDCFLKAR